MSNQNLIPVTTICIHYNVENDFLSQLQEHGLVSLSSIEKEQYIEEDHLERLEKILRLHQELHINMEGIDAIFNLLEKIEHLQKDLLSTRTRLRIYEE